jgi:hypothetical protein
MTRPPFTGLPPDLPASQQRWLALGRERNGRAQHDELYARKFGEPFARLFAELPLHGAPPDPSRPCALISVLGLSWQPVLLMAAWYRPTRRLILGSEASLSLEQAIESALAPGRFVSYRDASEFIEDVEALQARMAPLIESGEARRAVAILQTFIAGCYEKFEEIDDSGGGFRQFVQGLFCDWARARRAAKANPSETAAMLLAWMENDDYGCCSGLEKEAVRILDRAGLQAFERVVREKAGPTEKDSYARRRKVEILKAIYEARRDALAWIATPARRNCPAERIAGSGEDDLAREELGRQTLAPGAPCIARSAHRQQHQRGPFWRNHESKQSARHPRRTQEASRRGCCRNSRPSHTGAGRRTWRQGLPTVALGW